MGDRVDCINFTDFERQKTIRTAGTGEPYRFATQDGWKGLWLAGRKIADVAGERAVRDADKQLVRSLPLLSRIG